MALLIFVGLQVGVPQAFEGPRRALFDTWQHWLPRHRLAEHVVIVAVDSQSLRPNRPWPWPRDLQARLVNRVLAAHPLVVGWT